MALHKKGKQNNSLHHFMLICCLADIRMEEMFYEKLDKRKRDRNNVYESLGGVMVDAGNEFGPGTAYGEFETLWSVIQAFFLSVL